MKYAFQDIKYSVEDCLSKGMIYEASLRLTVRLVVFDTDSVNDTKSIRDIKEQEIYFGTLPMMTERGTFIVNGTERAVVSQLHRSPGAFFDHDKGKTHSSGKLLYSARIIPLRGSWLDFEFDPKDILFVRIDRRRKFPVTIPLQALGYSSGDLLQHFYGMEMIGRDTLGWWREPKMEDLRQEKVSKEIVDPASGEVLARAGAKFSKRLLKSLQASEAFQATIPLKRRLSLDFLKDEELQLVGDILDPDTGDSLAVKGKPSQANFWKP